MKNMKRLIFLFAAVALAVSFSGCKDDPAGTYPPDEFWIRATGMTLSKTDITLKLGGGADKESDTKSKLDAIFTPADTFNKNVTRKFDESVVSVAANGEMRVHHAL